MPDAVPKKKVTRYQTFPDRPGGSKSFEKLKLLRLPPMAGLSFLDVGCNEGFFCGYAIFDGAARAVGIDMNNDFLEHARVRFPNCEFLNQTWDTLPEEKFDVILLASAIHYAVDQPELIARLVDHLTHDGTLVVELGVFSSPANEWVPVKRSIDTRYFPTWSKLHEVLEGYAWKFVGRSVDQAGDPVGRFVIHIRRRRPVAYLLLLPSSYGKTSVSRALFPKADVPIIMGDVLLEEIATGKLDTAGARIREFLAATYVKGEADRAVRELFAADLADEFIAAWIDRAKAADFAFDGYIPLKHQDFVIRRLLTAGYFPVRMTWSMVGSPLKSLEAAEKASQEYSDYLVNGTPRPLPVEAMSAAPDPLAGLRAIAGSNWRKKIVSIAKSFWLSKPPSLRDRWKKEGISGFIDVLKVHGRVVSIGGWAVNRHGALPKIMVLRIGGKAYVRENMPPLSRVDVHRALGLDHPYVGFDVDLYLEDEIDSNNLLQSICVTAGDARDDMSNPFRMSSRIRFP